MKMYVIAENNRLELPIDYVFGQPKLAEKLGVKKLSIATAMMRARKRGCPYAVVRGYRIEEIGEVPNNFKDF